MQRYIYQMNYDEQSCTIMGYAGDEEDITIPAQFGGNPVTILYDKLFAGHTEIRSISFPDTITDFGEFLFDGCTNLQYLQLPVNLRNLWGYTFVRCGLKEITLPDPIHTIPPYAFKDCKNLEKVVCGSGMRKILAWAFGGCDHLQELLHGPDVIISAEAFDTNADILEVNYH